MLSTELKELFDTVIPGKNTLINIFN